jgi:hypothetical protein
MPYQFTVTVGTAGEAVPNAQVCAWKQDDFYAVGYTNDFGEVPLDINPQTQGGFSVTVTGRNCYPLEDSAWVINGDVGVLEITDPTQMADSGAVLTPKTTVKNFGLTVASFPVMFTTEGYSSAQFINNLLPDSTCLVEFDTWTPTRRGENICQCSTAMVGDENLENDFVLDTTFIQVRDVGVSQIVSPNDTLYFGDTVVPITRIHNYGNMLDSFSVRFQISPDTGENRIVYENSLRLTLEPGQDTTLFFPEWIVSEPGNFTGECKTELDGDMNPDNDSLAEPFFVIPMTGIFETNSLNKIIGLRCQPNPFLNEVNFKCEIIKNEDCRLKIYNVTGNLVRSFQLKPNHSHQISVVWDGKNGRGQVVNQGIYFIQFESPSIRAGKKLLKLRTTKSRD